MHRMSSLVGDVTNVCAKPTELTLQQVRDAIHNGYFGQLKTVKHVLKKFPDHGIHDELVACFSSPVQLSAEEQSVYTKMRNLRTCGYAKAEFLICLRALQALHASPQPSATSSATSSASSSSFTSSSFTPSTSAASLTSSTAPVISIERLGDVNLDTAARFCLVNSRLAELRVKMLMLCGFCGTESSLREKALELQQEQARIRHLGTSKTEPERVAQTNQTNQPKPKTPVKLYMQLVQRIGPIAQQTNAEEILTALRGFGTGSAVLLEMVCRELESLNDEKKKDLARELRLHNNRKLTKLDNAHRLCQRGVWHKALYDEMLQLETQKAEQSAFPVSRVRSMMSRFAHFILELESHVATHTKNTKNTEDLRDFLRSATLSECTAAVRSVIQSHEVRNDRVKASRHAHHLKSHAQVALRFLHAMQPHISCDLSRLNVNILLQGLVNRRVPADLTKRRVYSDAELDAMEKQVCNPAESLLFTLLREVGLRNSALCHLRYSNLLTSDTHKPREICSVMEKGRRPRSFQTSSNLQAKILALAEFLRERESNESGAGKSADVYVFNLAHPHKPLSCSALAQQIRRIAQSANITDISVHPHAFRHTLVHKLVNAGNSLEIVAKFIGHADPATTANFYYVPTPEEIGQKLINPFGATYQESALEENESRILLEVANAKSRTCRDMMQLVWQCSDEDTRQRVLSAMPHFYDALGCIDTPLHADSDTHNTTQNTSNTQNTPTTTTTFTAASTQDTQDRHDTQAEEEDQEDFV